MQNLFSFQNIYLPRKKKRIIKINSYFVNEKCIVAKINNKLLNINTHITHKHVSQWYKIDKVFYCIRQTTNLLTLFSFLKYVFEKLGTGISPLIAIMMHFSLLHWWCFLSFPHSIHYQSIALLYTPLSAVTEIQKSKGLTLII